VAGLRKILCIIYISHAYFLNVGDGSCRVWRCDQPDQLEFTGLTGPEFDPITSIRAAGGKLYTTCRDGLARVYSCTDIL